MPGFVDVSGMTSEQVRRLGHEDDSYDEPKRSQVKHPTGTFTAAEVWSLAAAVDRINEGYFKEDQWMMNATPAFLAKRANKRVVRECLQKRDFSIVTEQDRINGEAYRKHFTTYTLKAMSGALNEFQMQAYKIACIEEFTGRNLLEFAIVSCLPSIAVRDRITQGLARDAYSSTQLEGNEGDVVIGDLTVVNTTYSKEYDKYRIHGRMGESVVDFWFPADLSKDNDHRIKARIKAHRDDKTTQLNYVKKIG